MDYESFLVLDDLLQQSQKLPDTAKIPTGKYFAGHNANLLTSCCIKFIQLRRGHAIRINSMGVPRKARNGKTIWTKGSSKGISDIQSVINGKFVAIEVKQKDKQSPAQLKYQKSIEQAGGKYLIVRQFQDLLAYLEKDELLINNEKTTRNYG